jgi:hypothetical protein
MDEFDLAHTGVGFEDFFQRVAIHERRQNATASR